MTGKAQRDFAAAALPRDIRRHFEQIVAGRSK
jgi:hypothetical protein